MSKKQFTMSDEQKKLFDGLTTLQQEISLSSLSGMNDIDSYNASSGKAKTLNTKRASVSEILINPNVVRFMDSMKADVVNDAIMSREEMMIELTLISRASMGDSINVGSLTELKSGFDVKIKAMERLSKMARYEEVETGNADSLADSVNKLIDRLPN